MENELKLVVCQKIAHPIRSGDVMYLPVLGDYRITRPAPQGQKEALEAYTNVSNFLHDIEGAGYGGMSEYESVMSDLITLHNHIIKGE